MIAENLTLDYIDISYEDKIASSTDKDGLMFHRKQQGETQPEALQSRVRNVRMLYTD